jgi:hypothetical protein
MCSSIVQSSGNKRVYDFSKKCTVLLIDRCGDAVTPLMTPWTYAAMLHEFLDSGITDNTVRVPDTSGHVRLPCRHCQFYPTRACCWHAYQSVYSSAVMPRQTSTWQ